MKNEKYINYLYMTLRENVLEFGYNDPLMEENILEMFSSYFEHADSDTAIGVLELYKKNHNSSFAGELILGIKVRLGY